MRILCTPAMVRWAVLGSLFLISMYVNGQPADLNFTYQNSKAILRSLLPLSDESSPDHGASATVNENFRIELTEEAFMRDREQEAISDETGIIILQIPPSAWGNDFSMRVSAPAAEEIKIRILNAKGKQVKRVGVKRHAKISFHYNLNPGYYYVEVVQGNTRRLQRLLKK